MTLEEAQTAWLTIVGSDWVNLVDVLEHNDGIIWQAYTRLRLEDNLETNYNSNKIKIKIK